MKTGNQAGQHYDKAFYASQSGSSFQAAMEMLPPVMARLNAKSVFDLGCGVGTWLSAAQQAGATRILGVDGPWVDRDALAIDKNSFRHVELETGSWHVDERFDLAISVEVLEHLTDAAGKASIGALCSLTDAVLFSAAIPEQRGSNHINERWQSYWAREFASHGFEACLFPREVTWDNTSIPFWYRQNIVLYARPERLAACGLRSCRLELVDVVHPELYTLRVIKRRQRRLRYRMRAFIKKIGTSLRGGASPDARGLL
jgi:SAM-dependent methyltransferase